MELTIDVNFGTNFWFKEKRMIYSQHNFPDFHQCARILKMFLSRSEIFLGGQRLIYLCIISQITICEKISEDIRYSFFI